MKEVIIRTNFNEKIGLGHLFRTKNLLKKFGKKNYKVTFALDNKIKNKKLLKFNYFFLYSNKKKFTSQSEDALILAKKIKKKNIKYIIVDDYRFDKTWEKYFFNKGKKIIVFEDTNNRKHLCDIIIDSRSADNETLEKNYENLVPKKCKKLLGPKYSIINPNIKKKKINKVKKLSLLFYFGGGGNFKNYKKLISNFTSTIQKDDLKNKIIVNIVVGPLAKNYAFLKLLSKKNKFIKIIYNKLDLSFILRKTSLFFGTASSIVNELNYLNIPSCLFSLSDNQNQNLKCRENFGQFLHLNKKEALDSKRIVDLLLVLVKNIKRFKKLSRQKTFTVDKYGGQRIFEEIEKSKNNIKKKKEN